MQFDVPLGGKWLGSIRPTGNCLEALLIARGQRFRESFRLSDYGGSVEDATADANDYLERTTRAIGLTKNRFYYRWNLVFGPHIEVELTQSETTILSADAHSQDVLASHTLCVHIDRNTGSRYVVTHLPKKQDKRCPMVYLHHLLTGLKNVDHINRNTLDNRLENLRDGTGIQNHNQKLHCTNTTGRRGVSTQGSALGFVAIIGTRSSSPHALIVPR